MFNDSDTELESDAVMSQVLDEIGIEVSGQLSAVAAPRTRLEAPAAAARAASTDDLLSRLAALKTPS